MCLTAAILGSEFIPWPSPMLDDMYQQPENASIQDHWDQDEEELYANNSVTLLVPATRAGHDLYCLIR